jgi:hypothetical protein
MPKVTIELEDAQASLLVDTLMQLAAMTDPNDLTVHDGINGMREWRQEHFLTDAQFQRLGDMPPYRDDDRNKVAADLRDTARAIDGQLPPDAPATWFSRRRR